MQAENRETRPPIHVEVTVPAVVFPAIGVGQGQPRVDERLEVHLLSHDLAGEVLPPVVGTEVATPGLRPSLFRLFELRDIAARARQLWVQVARLASGRVADEVALLLEVRTLDPQHPDQFVHVELTPGLHSVVIFLDEEGRPYRASIDGAQD